MKGETPETGTDDLRAERARRGRSNRNRGAAAERSVAKWLRANGFPGAERAVRAAYVGSDRVIPDPGDLTGTPGLVWQVKDCQIERIGLWLTETEQQRGAVDADYGVLVVRRRGYADPGQWWCWLPLDALLRMGLGGLPTSWSLDSEPVRLELRAVARMLNLSGYGYDDPAVTE